MGSTRPVAPFEQAILAARALAQHLALGDDVAAALAESHRVTAGFSVSDLHNRRSRSVGGP